MRRRRSLRSWAMSCTGIAMGNLIVIPFFPLPHQWLRVATTALAALLFWIAYLARRAGRKINSSPGQNAPGRY